MNTWVPRPPRPDEPACWSWPVPPLRDREIEISRYMALQEGLPIDHTLDLDVLESLYDAAGEVGMRFIEFHTAARMAPGRPARSRCAICGQRPSDGRTVDDHCHATGQTRGYLCFSCNVREGRSGDPIFIRYRRIHPAKILGYYVMYTGRGWLNGWSQYEHRGDLHARGVRSSTPWPRWSPDTPLDQRLKD